MSSAHKKTPHHLSQAAVNRTGWVEGLTNLTEDSPATALLDTMDRFAGLKTTEAPQAEVQTQMTSEEQLAARIDHAIGVMQRELHVTGEVLMDIGSPSSWGRVIDTPEKRTRVISLLRTAAGDHCLS